MLFEQNLNGCFQESIGDPGISPSTFTNILTQTSPIISRLREQQKDLPLLSLPAQTDDLATISQTAAQIRNQFSTVIVLGTGGSTLNGQAITGLQNPFDTQSPKLIYMDNIDPHTVSSLLKHLDLTHTAFISISKSGKTLETLAQTLLCIQALGADNAGKHFTIITDPTTDNPLRRLASSIDAQILDHEPNLGGRFSTFSNVGLLPAAILDLDISAFRHGAATLLNEFFNTPEPASAQAAAMHIALMQNAYQSNVLMPYVDRLLNVSQWYRQIWAESLGKQGEGTTPIVSRGTLDQHSQLQLYLDGPHDKYFTLMRLGKQEESFAAIKSPVKDSAFDYIQQKTLEDIIIAEYEATRTTLQSNHCPVRSITLPKLNEESLGALMMHSILETVITAGMLQINAFDQPAVEEGKILARKILEDAA